MKDKIESLVEAITKDLFHVNCKVVLTRPDPKFGDFSSNVALQIANISKRQPMEIANQIASLLKHKEIEEVSVAAPGYINIWLSVGAFNKSLLKSNQWKLTNKDELMLVEFGNANPFKEMHLGHLYSAIVGDAIAHLLEASGAQVKRVSYHGDVGLQVAKWIWAVGQTVNWDMTKVDKALAGESIGHYYAMGAKAYDENELATQSIREINGHIYKKDDKRVNEIYDKGFDFSFKKFAAILDEIKIKFDKRYLESQSSEVGIKIVKDNTPKVFEESEGATIYRGEKVGLHTVVFINSQGLPTYGAKDLGLTQMKKKDYPKEAKSIVITGNEQTEYFKVMLAALSEIDPKTSKLTKHIVHGFLSLTSGKMSSRTGDVFEVSQLISDVKKQIKEQYPDSEINEEIFLAALKYTFLRQKIGTDILFDVKESVSLDGNSGPYIQYAYARTCSILEKFNGQNKDLTNVGVDKYQTAERHLAMKINEFPDVVERAINDYMPHHICTYLYDLAQTFNRFYENNRVIDDPRMLIRINLIKSCSEVLKTGLKLLNVPAPERM